MRAMVTMDEVICKVIGILRSHQMDAYNRINHALVMGQISNDQHSLIVKGMDNLFDDAIEQVKLCESPAEIDLTMKKFEVIAQNWVRSHNLPCNF